MNSEKHLKSALQKLLTIYCNNHNKPIIVNNIWNIIINNNQKFLDRIQQIDEFIKNNEFLEDIGELLFDISLVYHLSVEVEDENYFDSPTWHEIEEKSIGRGSELLNLLLYIDEAKSNDIEISVDDFLNEHLLVEDDDLRQDVDIYEPFIANPEISEAEIEDIIAVKNNLDENHPLKDFFVPIALFFKHCGTQKFPDYKDKISLFEQAVLQCLLSFESGN